MVIPCSMNSEALMLLLLTDVIWLLPEIISGANIGAGSYRTTHFKQNAKMMEMV